MRKRIDASEDFVLPAHCDLRNPRAMCLPGDGLQPLCAGSQEDIGWPEGYQSPLPCLVQDSSQVLSSSDRLHVPQEQFPLDDPVRLRLSVNTWQ